MSAADKPNGNDIRARVLDLVANRAGVDVSLLADDTDIFRDAGIGHDFEIDYQDDVYGLVEDLTREFDVHWLEVRGERHFPDSSEPLRFSHIPELTRSFFWFVYNVLLLPVALVWPRIYVKLGIVIDGSAHELPEPIADHLLPEDYIPITVADLVRVAEHRIWECRYDSPNEARDQPRISPRHLSEFLRHHRSRYGQDTEKTVRQVVAFVAEWRSMDVAQIREDMDLHRDLWIGAGLARWARTFTDYEAFFNAYCKGFEVATQNMDYQRHFPGAFSWAYVRLAWSLPLYILGGPFRLCCFASIERSKQWLYPRLDRLIWKLGKRWFRPRRSDPEYRGITVADLVRSAQLGLWQPKCDNGDQVD